MSNIHIQEIYNKNAHSRNNGADKTETPRRSDDEHIELLKALIVLGLVARGGKGANIRP